jgi:tRNA threonylcarbamoyladenosine biosynthesis protein TsaE
MVIFLEEINYENIESKIKEILENKKMKFKYIFKSRNENDTITLGNIFAKYITIGDILTLNGELGSGKTVFVKGIGNYFNIQSDVSSPTFTIVNEYNTNKFPIYHFDVYRLNDMYNFIDTIGTDYFSKGASFIEWGAMLEEILPRNTIHIDFEKLDNNSRNITIWR